MQLVKIESAGKGDRYNNLATSDKQFMHCSKKIWVTLITGLMFVSLSGCNTPPPNPDESSPPATSSSQASPTPASGQTRPTPTASQSNTRSSTARESLNAPPQAAPVTPAAKNTATVTVYTADSQCQNLVPEKVTVPAGQPIQGAVGKIIEERNTADFSLAGYRVNVDPSGVATIDMRLAPNSKRRFTSLSSCEQMALFGSLRKTLTSNPQWQISDVRFTSQGEEIVL